MFLDHTTAFSDSHPVDFLFDLKADTSAIEKGTKRPQSGGFLPTTRVETAHGFKQVRALRPGDKIYTFDGGLRQVINIRHTVPRLCAMVKIPAGALGNDRDLELPSDMLTTLDMDTADRLFGTPLVVCKLISLVGHQGITTTLPQNFARVHLEFSEEELVWSEGAMLINSATAEDELFYPLLSLAETRQLLASNEGRALATAGYKEDMPTTAAKGASGAEEQWNMEWTTDKILNAIFGRKVA